MTRESVDAKGQRYLVQGRLILEHVDASLIRATCRGSGSVYVLGWNGGTWWCGCAARGRCSHLVALQLVTVRPGDAESESDADEPRLASAAFHPDDDAEPPLCL